MSDRDYTIRGYAPVNQGGGLLLETWHRGEASRDVELSAWRARMRRGEVSRVEIDDHNHPQKSWVLSHPDQEQE